MRTKKATEINATEKILLSALREFSEHGLAGARVDRIASKAGINKAMIYYYFRSKENLYQTVIHQQLSKVGTLAEEIISKESTLESFCLRLAEFYNSFFEDREDFVPIFLREVASGSERIKTTLNEIIAQKGLSRKVKKMIEDGKKKGLFRNVDARQTIISFIGMNLFYLIMAPIINSIWEIKDEKKFRGKRPQEIVDLFLHGLKKR
jgi:TetR/AcrR family transcriptional regulator